MLAYFALLTLPIIPALLYTYKKDEKYIRKTIHVFFILLIILLCLRRIDIGVDLQNYKYYFDLIRQLQWNQITEIDIEIGYVFLNKIFGMFTDNFQLFIAFVALIQTIPIYISYLKEAKRPYLSIIIFANMSAFVILFSGLRQAIAIAIGAIAYHFVVKKKFVFFVACVGIAFLFHQSALILLILYPLFHSKITKNWLWFIIPSITMIFILNKQIFNYLVNFLGDKYIDRYASVQNTGAHTMIILFVLFLFFSYIMVDEKTLDKTTLGLRNIMVLVVMIQLFAPIHALAMRFNYYFIIFIPVLISRIVDSPKKHFKPIAQIANVVMVCYFTFYFFYNAYTSVDILQVFPYKFFWE